MKRDPYVRAIAMALFIFLPLLGFVLGIEYERMSPETFPEILNVNLQSEYACRTDNDCVLRNESTFDNTTGLCCSLGNCVDNSLATVKAVNKNWYAKLQTRMCSTVGACPMIAIMCKKPSDDSVNYHAHCVHNACQKVLDRPSE